jgi:hypothetical protein
MVSIRERSVVSSIENADDRGGCAHPYACYRCCYCNVVAIAAAVMFASTTTATVV